MNTIRFITSNKGKIEEARHVLSPLGFTLEPLELDLVEIQSLSQEEVIKHKAREARARVPEGAIVIEDTGFYIDHYNHFPGALGKFVIKAIGVEGIHKLLMGIEPNAHFLSTVAFIPHGSSEPILFHGRCNGKITLQTTTSHPHLPYDSIFIPDGATVTFGVMSHAEKARYSHRTKALAALANWLKEGEI